MEREIELGELLAIRGCLVDIREGVISFLHEGAHATHRVVCDLHVVEHEHRLEHIRDRKLVGYELERKDKGAAVELPEFWGVLVQVVVPLQCHGHPGARHAERQAIVCRLPPHQRHGSVVVTGSEAARVATPVVLDGAGAG